MASSLFQNITRKVLSSQQSNLIQQFAAAIKGDPRQAMAGILQQNPEVNNKLNALVQGRDPQQVFYQKCGEMGIDPEDILKWLR